MKNISCPVSLVSIDSNIARINAFYTGMLIVIFLFTQQASIILFLILDFSTIIFYKPKYSLLFRLSSLTKKILKLKSIKVDLAPKRLANYFGLLFVTLIALTGISELIVAMYILIIILLICIFLEVLFSYCLGCQIYYIYKNISSNFSFYKSNKDNDDGTFL